jgi:hypothetical protein
MSAVELRQREQVRQATQDQEQYDANPKCPWQLLRGVSHAGWRKYTLKKKSPQAKAAGVPETF